MNLEQQACMYKADLKHLHYNNNNIVHHNINNNNLLQLPIPVAVNLQNLSHVPSSSHQTVTSRWAVQQLHQLQRHYHNNNNGKNLKEGSSGDEKKDDSNDGLWANVEAQAAFLGPNLWDKNLPYDADLKYVDLDEFLSENGIPLDQPSPTPSATATSSASASPPVVRGGGSDEGGGEGPSSHHHQQRRSLASELHVSVDSSSDCTKRERSQSPYDPPLSPSTIGPPSPTDSTMSFSSNTHDFDPRTRAFSDEELKPQPMIKKSRKQFVPDDLKDEKYWARRRKNNMAAKRSRDARRVKENQIALRAGFLEKENSNLRSENERLKKENSLLRSKLEKLTKGN